MTLDTQDTHLIHTCFSLKPQLLQEYSDIVPLYQDTVVFQHIFLEIHITNREKYVAYKI